MLGQRAGRLVIAVTSLALVLIAAHVLPFAAAVLIATATLAAFATAAWHYVLEVDEREIVGRLLSRFVAVGAPR
jgi:L-fucose isomerase-like protein